MLSVLPLTEEDLTKLILKYAENDTAETANVVIGRLRDFHNPLAGDHKQEDWNRFVLALVDLWSSDPTLSSVVASHLKEIIGEGGKCGEVIVKYTQKKLLKIVKILKQIKVGEDLGSSTENDVALKLIESFSQCQKMYLELFEGACCKLLSSMLHIAGQLYQLIGDSVCVSQSKSKVKALRRMVTQHVNMTKT